jgi:hypothetical protein
MSDFGLCIHNSVRTVLQNQSDDDAIIAATREGFTSKSVQNNAGVGLHYLLNTVVNGLRGRVTIYSLGGIVTFSLKGTECRPTAYKGVGFCPGTTIAIGLRTDAIPSLPPGREELTW